MNPKRSGLLAAALAATLAAAGCTHLGPKTVMVDRFDYSSAIADSWKQQTLLNIVKLRYMDMPVFVEVSSIVAGYSMQTGVTVGATSSSSRAVQGDYVAANGQAIYTDRPTITYAPLTGEKYLQGLITPIDPKNIFFLLQSGYPADFILGLTVESLNGVRNRSAAGGSVREADPEFTRALQLLREVQLASAVGMRVEEDKVKGSTAILFFKRDDVPPEISAKSSEIRRLLHVPVDAERVTLKYSPVRGAEGELAVNSRSMMQIMTAFSSYIDAPREHIEDHSASPGFEDVDPANKTARVEIQSGKDKPKDAYAAVNYRGYWFWIEQGNWQTKRALAAIMLCFALAETGGNDKLPLITIPAQ
jgi:hypothetical protein